MAKNDRAINKATRNIRATAQGISDNMDYLYRSTYMSTPQQSNDLKDLNDRINNSIDNIVTANANNTNIPNVSKLYSRIAGSNKSDGSKKFINGLENMFDNGLMADNLYDMFMSNRYLRELDTEIDTVLKYMPRLEEALEVQKDCVLSADHFSKDFLNIKHPGYSIDEKAFAERAKDIKKKYALTKLVEEIYEDTSRYGEKFIYRVPYKIAIGKLLATKPDGQLVSPTRGINESDILNDNSRFMIFMDNTSFRIYGQNNTEYVSENASISVIKESKSNEDSKFVNNPILNKNEHFNIALEISTSNVIESAVLAYKNANEKRKASNSMASLHEAVINESKDNKEIVAKGNVDWGKNTIDNRMVAANDGLIGGSPIKPIPVDVSGCVIKKLERDQVIPIYIEDMCMGYYYFEIRTVDNSEAMMGFKNLLGDPMSNINGNPRTPFNAVDTTRQDDAIKFVAGQLSKFIDRKFVNSNQDLAKEIYMILKYNDLFNTPSIDLIKVTFIPPEDMVHFYFKKDPKTHRGLSDLSKSLIPAKIYSSLYITDSIAHLTRGQDKRVYYVKQTVDTNIAQTLLNTISQIKQSNFGIRQFQNINNVLNISGRFNDYVIPTNASGDAPIQFEVMPGQDINSPTEIMEKLEEMAINSTGIPIEIIQARQSVDYAMQLTMSSSKVLRWCYKRQELFEKDLSDLITSIYNYEYNESISITVTLPPPSFINVTNTNQLVDNTRNFVQSVVDVELANEQDDKLKNAYTKALFNHYLGTHLDLSAHVNILDRCKLEVKKEDNETHSDGEDNDY